MGIRLTTVPWSRSIMSGFGANCSGKAANAVTKKNVMHVPRPSINHGNEENREQMSTTSRRGDSSDFVCFGFPSTSYLLTISSVSLTPSKVVTLSCWPSHWSLACWLCPQFHRARAWCPVRLKHGIITRGRTRKKASSIHFYISQKVHDKIKQIWTRVACALTATL